MNFIHSDLGYQKTGEIVEIVLSGNAANVRLMDSSNFNNYKSGRAYRCYGGLATRSPVRLSIPCSGHWHVAVDMQGLRGRTNAGIRMLSGPMPELRQPSLSSVPSLVHNKDYYGVESDSDKSYDVFISHASEDKDEIVRPLATALIQEGLSVWYDEFELRIGDSLKRKIDKGPANSRFGVVILSKDFFKKGWTNYELDGIISKANTGEQVLLPIWHKLIKKDVIDFSPSLADKVARNTSTNTIEEIANEIAELIKLSLI